MKSLVLYNESRLIPLKMDEVPNKGQFKTYFWMHIYTHYAYKIPHNMVASILQITKYLFF